MSMASYTLVAKPKGGGGTAIAWGKARAKMAKVLAKIVARVEAAQVGG